MHSWFRPHLKRSRQNPAFQPPLTHRHPHFVPAALTGVRLELLLSKKGLQGQQPWRLPGRPRHPWPAARATAGAAGVGAATAARR